MRAYFLGLLLFAALLLPKLSYANDREKINFNRDWRFAYGHPFDTQKDFGTGTGYFTYLAKAGYGDGATAQAFDDRAWRELDLPHDWAAEMPFSEKASHSHGYKTVGRNFPETSVGWYRKHFNVAAEDDGKQFFIDFDGVSRNAQVWVNGFYLGQEPSGYQSFSYNISEYLNYGGENVIAVRADVTMEEGWYYEGAGIYRNVWLRKTAPLHIPKNGTFIHSEINGNAAIVTVEAKVFNAALEGTEAKLTHEIYNPEGTLVAKSDNSKVKLNGVSGSELKEQLTVENPSLWSLEQPQLYTCKTKVYQGSQLVDEYTTRFGIRTIKFDADKGFFLNGKHVKLKGTNLHQDHAGVGVAMTKGVMAYRISLLKDMGSNAIRSSHNPPTPELLDLCDEMGMLVINENRLMGTHDEALHEVSRLMERDRNHPSVIVWSVGNEEWMIEGNEKGARIAAKMQEFAKQYDTTRPINAAISGGWGHGISTTIDVMGFNYLPHGNTDEYHKQFPNTPTIGTEEGSTFATRGIYFDDSVKQYIAAYDRKPREIWYTIEGSWQYYAARDYLTGMFIWTGLDYHGEPTPYSWPSNLSYFGMMDLCGFPKDNVFYLKSWWQDKETVLHILPHWNLEGKEGEEVPVWVYSNCTEVELFLNGKSLGRKAMETNGHLEWQVKYKAGEIKAIGYDAKGKKIKETKHKTTGAPARIKMEAATHHDVAMVKVSVEDKKGLQVPTAGNNITFEIEGGGKLIGVGNGDPTGVELEQYVDKRQLLELPEVKVTELTEELMQSLSIVSESGTGFSGTEKALISTFNLEKGAFENAEISWFCQKVANNTMVYLNGQNVGRKDGENEIVLKRELFKEGENKLVIVGEPLPKKNQWDEANKVPGTIQLITAAPKWNRSLFNGLAQVIVQFDGTGEDVTLKATADGLKEFTLTIAAPKQ
ncbi:beta-galactosidase GalA [Limibacter armeniacum]|uniref:beta-galactosidase GalA n=1 Tax=Limibacter armeniacum TaxID=466084 RepID=UPI002FE6644A